MIITNKNKTFIRQIFNKCKNRVTLLFHTILCANTSEKKKKHFQRCALNFFFFIQSKVKKSVDMPIFIRVYSSYYSSLCSSAVKYTFQLPNSNSWRYTMIEEYILTLIHIFRGSQLPIISKNIVFWDISTILNKRKSHLL